MVEGSGVQQQVCSTNTDLGRTDTVHEQVVTDVRKETVQVHTGVTPNIMVQDRPMSGINVAMVEHTFTRPTDLIMPATSPSTTGMNLQKGEIKAGITICSPYLNRKVDPHTVITRDETILSNWIFSSEGDKLFAVYKYVDGTEL